MKFNCLFVNKRTNKKINKDFTVKEIDKYLGEYIKDRAIKRGYTTTTRREVMDAFVSTTAVPAPMRISNVDTDMIIPAEHLKTIERTGLGKHAFSRMRYDADGEENESFVLNQPMYRGTSILLAEDNFGCGSSREHAPWALLDLGIKCVISTSFADIFFNNCFKNGILPIRVSQDVLGELFLMCF